MKILLITPTHPHLTLWQPQNLWRRALIKLRHQVKLFRLPRYSIKLLTHWQLQQTINRWQPDEIFFSAGKDAILPIKDTVFFTGVSYSMLSRNEQLTGLRSRLVLVNDEVHVSDWLAHGAKKAICLPISAIDPQLHRPTSPVPKYQSDVVFIGGLSLKRQQLFLKLLPAKINLNLYGTLPDNFLAPVLKGIYHGPVWGQAIPQIYSSCKIALNPVPAHLPTGGNLRTFEIPGCGAFQLASRTHPDWFTDGKDIVLYSHASDLIKKIHYYLIHHQLRRRLAQAGYNRTHRDHTYKKRFGQLFKTQLAS